MFERSVLGEKPLMIFCTIIPLPLRLLISVNLNADLQRKGMEIGTFLPIAAGNVFVS
jgi:hypothetical protein